MSRRRVGLATCREYPDLDADDGLLLPALEALGIQGVPLVWDDPAVQWDDLDLVVVRSTWDYAERREVFLAWARDVDARVGLANRAEVLAANTDKRYLGELAAAGIPTVPTRFVAPGDPVPALPTEGDHVVKPAVSAGSRDTARYRAGTDDAAALAHLDRLLAQGRTVMLQPYLDAVDTAGETALLFIDGEWSHTVRKGPLLAPGEAPTEELFAAEEIGPREATSAQRHLAEAVIAAAPDGLLYARADLLDTTDGPVLLELELTEPSLFLTHDEGAADRFARAIAARLG